MYKEMHGVFEVIEDAIDAAYEAQRILEANYTTEDRQKFIDAVKAEAEAEMDEAVKFADESPYPDPATVLDDMYVTDNERCVAR